MVVVSRRVRIIGKATVTFVVHVCPAPTGRILIKYDIRIFLEKSVQRLFKFHYNLTRIMGIWNEK